ncbi:DUF302 domain-containing protein [Ostreibacterium oceani]|uniref:DUF302 domain-containing protein n=1 Tax=Ostreibacterium oceani TaxID=2654998 RepID=A0A6N7ESU8_9GAMM|nr:DUF302 domain-containing protein [Ostreibacterium oceani]MPV85914.1 DUF302 domain-containing protein [Ostreibacterium oceani]
MKKVIFFIGIWVMQWSHASEGLVAVESQFDVNTTAERLVEVLEAKGMTVVSQVNHAQAANKVGIELRETRLVIFGNPKVGSPLMQCAQAVAIDLPQKALIWQDDAGKVWLGYNDVDYLKQRHNIKGCDAVITKVKGALAAFAAAATAGDK